MSATKQTERDDINPALGLGWDTVNTLAADACRDLVYGGGTHLDGVRVLGVDEHKWKH